MPAVHLPSLSLMAGCRNRIYFISEVFRRRLRRSSPGEFTAALLRERFFCFGVLGFAAAVGVSCETLRCGRLSLSVQAPNLRLPCRRLFEPLPPRSGITIILMRAVHLPSLSLMAGCRNRICFISEVFRRRLRRSSPGEFTAALLRERFFCFGVLGFAAAVGVSCETLRCGRLSLSVQAPNLRLPCRRLFEPLPPLSGNGSVLKSGGGERKLAKRDSHVAVIRLLLRMTAWK